MSNKLVQASRLLGTVALLAWLCSTLSTQVESKTSSKMAAVNKDVPGLKTTVFETPKGKISVNIPDDTSASDEITGTVLAEPAGETQEEKAKNEDELNGYVVELAKAEEPPKPEEPDKKKKSTPKTSPKSPPISALIPAGCSGITIVLKNSSGTTVCQNPVPVNRTPPAPACGATENVIPTVGVCGRPIPIKGKCDGKFGNSEVKVGGQEAPLLAESPRQKVAQSPNTLCGQTTIESREGNQVARGKYNNLRVKLSAAKLALQKGETTVLNVLVEGLEGVTEPVKLRLENRTPKIVKMTGGDRQDVMIYPEQSSTPQNRGALVASGSKHGAVQIRKPMLTPQIEFSSDVDVIGSSVVVPTKRVSATKTRGSKS